MLLADFAAGAPAAGIELSVSYLFDRDGSPGAARLRQRGIEPELVPVGGLLSPSSMRTVRRHLAERRPDVVHTHLLYADLLGGVAARSLGLPSVSTVHVMAWEGDARERAKLRLAAAVRRRSAGRVVAVSDVARELFLRAGWDTPERVVTVRNGIAGETRPGAGGGVRAELGLRPDDVVVSMVTVLRAGKGHDVALEAVGALRERFPRLRLLVLGDGPQRAEIERLAAPLGDAAVLAGHRDDVMAVLDASDLVLHPSSADAFPTALMEAGAAGVPVVASDVGGIPEIVEHGVTGLLVPTPPEAAAVAGALAQLLADPGRRAELGRAGAERFRAEFTAERWAERTRTVYEAARSLRRPGGFREAARGRVLPSRGASGSN